MFHLSGPTVLLIPPGIAGLMLFIGLAIIAVIPKRWQGIGDQLKVSDSTVDNGGLWADTAKLRYVLLALILWIALSAFLIVDFAISASVHLRFTAAYAAFWVLVGALLLHGSPRRRKVLILGLFAMAILSVPFINWNSRKPFLRDFYRIEEGVTPAQVDEIMDGYMKGHYGGPPLSLTDVRYEFNDQGEIVTGWVTYRHTEEGWGDSDWGTVTFEDGRVVRIHFSPD